MFFDEIIVIRLLVASDLMIRNRFFLMNIEIPSVMPQSFASPSPSSIKEAADK